MAASKFDYITNIMIIYKHKKSAFTLIELSIVLVIIGLIVGGIMVGQSLIESGRIRAQMTQISDIETQMNTFKLKYDCLPGDCSSATSIFGTTFGTNTVRDGDNDGIIRGTYAYGVPYGAGECIQPDATGEVSQLLLQLRAANLGNYTANGVLNGGNATVGNEYTATAYDKKTGLLVSCLASTAHPTYMPAFFRTGNIIVIGFGSATIGRIGYGLGTYGKYFWGTYGYYSAVLFIQPIGIPADVVRQIDDKIDDGKPSSGKFGIIDGDVSCTTNATVYPNPSTYCRATAGKRIN